jgi:hypothetical protein
LVNTTIHFARAPDPNDLLASPWRFPWKSDRFHWAMLEKSFGGWYPRMGQLNECADGRFEMTNSVDGTQDYHWTSEAWLTRVQRELKRLTGLPRLAWRSLPAIAGHPKQCTTMLVCMLVSQSWNWQFRTDDPPTRLLRQSWRYRPDH